MNTSLFSDQRASGLLSRVREDISHLRADVGDLLSHTTRKTFPNGARDLVDQARQQLSASGNYAASKIRDMRGHAPSPQVSWVGGAILVGLLAYGAYALCQNSKAMRLEDAEDELDDLPR